MAGPDTGVELDLIVAGAGPSALAVLHAARQAGLSALAVDKGPLCAGLLLHPVYMKWFSTSDKLELGGFPLVSVEKNPTRFEYLKYLRAFVRYFALKVVAYHTVTAIEPQDAGFAVRARDLYGRDRTWRAARVVVSTGFMDHPRPLGVPGEDLPKVTHYYREPHPYAGHEVLVVGAGSSAAETALELYRAGARVTVAMRGDRFLTKYWLEPDIENRIGEGAIACHRRTDVVSIGPDDVTLRDATGRVFTIANEFVLAMTGYEPDTSLLVAAGAAVDRATGKPVLTPHYESMVSGLYVAGTLVAGKDSNAVFIENSREHGPAIVRHIVSGQRPA